MFRRHPATPPGLPARAFTIIELMVVIMLIGMFLGASFAMFRSMGQTNQLAATGNEVNAMLRRARSTALARSSRVEIGFELFRNRGVIVSQIRNPVTHFHFEEAAEARQAVGTGRIRADVTDGLFTDMGRTGRALKLFGSAASRAEIETTDARFDCPRGVALSADIFIELESPVYIVGRGGSYFLRIDEFGQLMGGGTFNGEVVLPPAAGDTEPRIVTDAIVAHTLEQVPVRRWVHVEMLFDQRGVRMFIDDVEVPVYVEGVETPEEVMARMAAGPVDDPDDEDPALALLPETWDPATRMAWVRFLNDGRLDPQVHTQPVELYIEMPEEGLIDQAYDLYPSLRDALLAATEAEPFRIRDDDNAPVIIGAGLFGRIDNAQVAELTSGDVLILPEGLVMTSQPSNVPVQDPDGTVRPMRVERRKITVELMGTVR